MAPVTTQVPLDGNGIACLVATRNGSAFDHWYASGAPSRKEFSDGEKSFADFMKTMHALVSQGPPLQCLDWDFKLLPQTLVTIPRTKVQTSAPDGMVTVPGSDRGAKPYNFGSTGLEIEQGDGCDLQLPWEDEPQVQHNHTLNLTTFHIDKYPVTTAQYAKYLQESNYRPRDPTRWLVNWNLSAHEDTPIPPQGLERKPVTYLGLDEARAYCRHYGKRLPHMWEWQKAAQGDADQRTFPWGSNGWNAPQTQHNNVFNGPEDVDAHPHGCSPYGACDLVGNVWQYTSELQDEHSRMAVLKGGANYVSQGSRWYFKQAHAVDTHNRITLMDDSYDRSLTVCY